MTERFIVSFYTDKIHDTVKKEEYYFEDMEDWHKICRLLNDLNDCDECRISKYELGVYRHFVSQMIDIMVKYDISSLAKLNQVLFEQRIW